MRMQTNTLREHLHELRGKVLGCWCKPADCHADLLLKLANNNSSSGGGGNTGSLNAATAAAAEYGQFVAPENPAGEGKRREDQEDGGDYWTSGVGAGGAGAGSRGGGKKQQQQQQHLRQPGPGCGVEASDSAYVFVCANPRALKHPQAISGQHKLWNLPPQLLKSVRTSVLFFDDFFDSCSNHVAIFGVGFAMARAFVYLPNSCQLYQVLPFFASLSIHPP